MFLYCLSHHHFLLSRPGPIHQYMYLSNFYRHLAGDFFFFLEPHMQHMEVACARVLIGATAASHSHSQSNARSSLSHIYNLHHSSWQPWILNPFSKARVWTQSSWILIAFIIYWTSQNGKSWFFTFNKASCYDKNLHPFMQWNLFSLLKEESTYWLNNSITHHSRYLF